MFGIPRTEEFMAQALILNNVSLRYGRHLAVERLSLRIEPGEIFGLLGPNGSGKSTTLAAVAGLLEPVEGSIRMDGLSPSRHRLQYAQRIGLVPQEPALYDELSAIDNLDFVASLYDLPARARRGRIDRILGRVGLTERANDRVATYSGGMKQRLNLAAGLLHEPAVLLLDEPSVALDPASHEMLFRLLAELRSLGRIIVIATHQLDEAERLCDRVGIMNKGCLLQVGRPGDVLHTRTSAHQIQGTLRDEITEETEIALRRQMDVDSLLFVEGRQVRLTARNGERLGLALSLLASKGVEFESFHTPHGRMDLETRNHSLIKIIDHERHEIHEKRPTTETQRHSEEER